VPDATFGARYVGVGPFTLNAASNPPVNLVLPSLNLATPGCAAATCTLTISGTGWLPGGTLTVVLIQCEDPECNAWTTNAYAGSVTAGTDGLVVDASITFQAPALGTPRRQVGTGDRVAPARQHRLRPAQVEMDRRADHRLVEPRPRRLSKDYEVLPASSETFIRLTMISIMLAGLAQQA
jgi:hypothetical protein